jgi:DnaJ domain
MPRYKMDESGSNDPVASGRYDWALTLLGINRDATVDEAKFSYRKLAFQYHPDRNPGDEQAVDQFKKIDSAWKALQNILPQSPVPLEIPDGASEREIEEIFVKWMLQPNNAPRKKPQEPSTTPPPESQDRDVWTTVGSESASDTDMTEYDSSLPKDWTRQTIKFRRGGGLEHITPEEAQRLIERQPDAFAALKIVQQRDPELCLFDAILARAQEAPYTPDPSKLSGCSELVIIGADKIDRAACRAALCDPMASVDQAKKMLQRNRLRVRLHGEAISEQMLAFSLSWVTENIEFLIKKHAGRRIDLG